MIPVPFNSSKVRGLQFSLRWLFVVVTAFPVVVTYLLTWEDATTIAIMAAIALPFYALLFGLAIYLRRPAVCAIVWVLLRLVFVVPFLAGGALMGGDEGFVFFAWNYSPDLPLLPILEPTQIAVAHFCGATSGNAFALIVYVIWYGGGGYLTARWARRR